MRLFCGVLLFFTFLGLGELRAQCVSVFNAPIPDNKLSQFFIDVEGFTDSILGKNGQGVCKVKLRFSHNHLSDLRIRLVSPAGQSVTLVGAPGAGFNTTGSSWDVTFVRCVDQAAPDIGLTPFWENSGNWQKNTSYTGAYFPLRGNCLENFNNGTVNGLWNLQILDAEALDTGLIASASIIFCNPEVQECVACYKKAGVLRDTTFTACEGNPLLNILLRPVFPNGNNGPGTAYKYVVGNKWGKIVALLDFPDLRNFTEGKYTIYGFAYDSGHPENLPPVDSSISVTQWVNSYSDGNPKLCGDVTFGKISINILPVTPVKVTTTFICTGNPIRLGDSTITTPGFYTLRYPNQYGCDSIINYDVRGVDFNVNIISDGILSCTNPLVKLQIPKLNLPPETKFHWFTIDGEIVGNSNVDSVNVEIPSVYFLAVSALGCTDTLSIVVNKDNTLPDLSIQNIILDCNQPAQQLIALSDNPLVVFQWTGPGGFSADIADPLVNTPGLYEVTASLPGGCSISKKVDVKGDFNPPTFSISDQNKICEADSVILVISGYDSTTQFNWLLPAGNLWTGPLLKTDQNGDFLISATGTNGCTLSKTIRVTFDHESPGLIVWDSVLNCSHPLVSLPLLSGGVFDSVAVIWPDGYIMHDLDTLLDQSGIYTVTLSNAKVCNVSAQFSISEDFEYPQVNINPSSFGCAQDSLKLASTITPPRATVEWSGPNNFFSNAYRPWVYEYGWYFVTATLANGCSTKDSVYIGIRRFNPVIDLNSDTITCLNPTASLKVNVTSPSSYTIRWSGPGNFSSASNPVTVTAPGKYWVKVTDGIGCFTKRSTLVHDITKAPKPVLLQDSISCNRDSAEIKLLNDSLYSIIQFITPAGDTITPSFPFRTIVQDTFLINLQDKYGCRQDTFIHVAIDDDLPKYSIDSFHITCRTPVIKLSIRSQTMYNSINWQFPNDSVVNGTAVNTNMAGQYQVTVINKNGCALTSAFYVSVDTIRPKLDLKDSVLTCRHPNFTMNYFTNARNPKFSWKGPGNFVSTLDSPVVNDTGHYSLLLTDEFGCKVSDTMFLGQGSRVPLIHINDDTINCYIPQLVINPATNASVPQFTWFKPDGSSLQSKQLFTSEGGVYIVEVRDSNLCAAMDTFKLTMDTTAPVINLLNEYLINCKDSVETLQIDSVRVNKFQWSTLGGSVIDTLSSVKFSLPGNYVVKAIGYNGCANSDTFRINGDFRVPDPIITSGQLNCIYSKVTMTAISDLSNSSYKWDINGEEVLDSTYTVDTAGFYTVTITGPNGCSIDTTIEVVLDTIIPEVAVPTGSLSCDSAEYKIKSNVSNPGGIYGWFGPANFYSGEVAPVVKDTGTYFLFYNAPNGCLAVDTFTINNLPYHPQVFLIPDTITCRDSVVSVPVRSDVPIESYLWEGSGNYVSLDSIARIAQPGILKVTISGDNGCTSADSIYIAIDTIAPPASFYYTDSIYCQHRKIKLFGVSPPLGDRYDYFWNSVNGRIISDTSNDTVWIDGPGIYRLDILSNRNGCKSEYGKPIDETPNPLHTIDAEVTPADCDGINNGSILITGTPNSSGEMIYSVYPEVYTTNTYYNKLKPGNYIVAGKDTTGCEVSDTFMVGVAHLLSVDLGQDTVINAGDSILMHAVISPDSITISTISWDPFIENCLNCISFRRAPVQSTRYSVFITSSKGCVATDSRLVTVDNDKDIFVPNVFTPNGDGKNDRVEISVSKNVKQLIEFVIYDRWGNQVYSASQIGDPENRPPGWDGEFQSRPVNPGIFVYYLKYTLQNGKTYIKKGDIALLR
jgi:gliding motility-associated-like protein